MAYSRRQYEASKKWRKHDPYVYQITNLITGEMYIGSSAIQPAIRYSNHKSEAKHPRHKIQYNIAEYGAENFEFKLICICGSIEQARRLEHALISKFGVLNERT